MRIHIAPVLLAVLMCNRSLLGSRYKIEEEEFDKYIAEVKNVQRMMMMENHFERVILNQARVISQTLQEKKEDTILRRVKIMKSGPYNLRLS